VSDTRFRQGKKCAESVSRPNGSPLRRQEPPNLDCVPRHPRAFTDGIYHLGARGSDTRDLFLNDDDREDFLDRLTPLYEQFELGLVSYVLMGSHYHTLVRIPDGRVSEALQRLHTEYSRHHNRRHGRSAHLFRAHPMALEVGSHEHLLAVVRYIALNPVKANLVRDPLDWRWGSARAHAGLKRPRIPLLERDLRAAFGGGSDWRDRYRAHIDASARSLSYPAAEEAASEPAGAKTALSRSRLAAGHRAFES
jgi:putative transposase